MAHHNKTGSIGEEMAAKYLTGNGFEILERNWRFSNWEVDFIASSKSVLHFIEVKTRRTKKFGNPEDDVSIKKMENLINASEEYLLQNAGWRRIQFDILSIFIGKNEDPEFFFIEDVYVP
ncbi:MAG: YraN family protein [Ginsengibacter sp.]